MLGPGHMKGFFGWTLSNNYPMSQRLHQLKKVLRGSFHWYRESPVVYIFQMGKVASTAIKNALLRRRIECYQPHFLSKDSFEKLLKCFEEVDMTDWAVDHLSAQIAENLKLYNRLIKFQNAASRDNQQLKVITLTREPLDWYFSNFAQNFGEYKQDVATFVAETGNIRIGVDEEEKILSYIEEFFNCLLNFASSHMTSFCPEERPRLGKLFQDTKFSGAPGNKILLKHCMILLGPFNWFDVHFDPVFNTHIIKTALSDDFSCRPIKLDYCEILILKYEDLFSNAVKALEEFLSESKPLILRRENIMSRNKTGKKVSAIKKSLVLPEILQVTMEQSPYMRAFYPS